MGKLWGISGLYWRKIICSANVQPLPPQVTGNIFFSVPRSGLQYKFNFFFFLLFGIRLKYFFFKYKQQELSALFYKFFFFLRLLNFSGFYLRSFYYLIFFFILYKNLNVLALFLKILFFLIPKRLYQYVYNFFKILYLFSFDTPYKGLYYQLRGKLS